MGSHLALQTSWKRCDINTTFYSLLCIVCAMIWGQRNSTSRQQQPQSLEKVEQIQHTQRHSQDSAIIPLCDLPWIEIFVERTLEIFLQIINSYKWSSITCICRNIFLSLPEPHWNVVLCWLSSVELPSFDLFGRNKAQECDEPNRGERGSIWFM